MSQPNGVVFNRTIPLAVAGGPGHNRWHPEIEPVKTVRPGEEIDLDLWDGLDGQATESSTAQDLLAFSRTRTHPMTGPIYVEGAEPGDLLTTDIVDIKASDRGVTCVIPGLGFLPDKFPEPFLVRWTIDGGRARSADLPGVAVPGAPFLGLIGVAPSESRLRAITAREFELSERGGAVRMPDATGATPAGGRLAREGLRTTPPREIGGNLDVKYLTKGSRITLPVDVPGALCSVGDAHFAQGDGEVCGVAIEMSARVSIRFELQKASTIMWRPRNPTIEFLEPAQGSARAYFATTGFPITEAGRNESIDVSLAARSALLEMLAYLTQARGLTDYQAYVLASVAVDLRISEIVDAPNSVVCAVLPLDLFE